MGEGLLNSNEQTYKPKPKAALYNFSNEPESEKRIRATLRSTREQDASLPKISSVSKKTCDVADWIKMAGDVICWRDLAMTVLSLLVQ
jgi:3-dehydroquinate dehydratase